MRAIAVAVITYQRPRGLDALLEGLAALETPAGAEVRVVVVDNDPTGSARPVVARWQERHGRPIDYAIEPARGIPHARNRAVRDAAGCDAIVFIDDDEVPEQTWLVELVAAQARSGAAIVTGPVVPIFEERPPPWLERFFARPRFPDGTEIGYARTSNVLIGAAALPHDEPAFSAKLAMTGGSDTHFFMRAVSAGHRIVWADRAVVHESMPATRTTVRWLLRREYRRGNTLSLCLRDLNDTWPARGKRLVRASVEFVRGLAFLAGAAVRGRPSALRGAQRLALAAGMVTGLAGVRYEEYAVIHGG